jgi:hypothetical protein
VDLDDPSRVLSNLINDYIEGYLDDYTFLFRAVVVAIDYEGGKLEGPEPGDNGRKDTTPNPKGSIKARVISKAMDKNTEVEDLPVFWPMFPHDVMPIKEGEHVYVVFEDATEKTHGLWLSRIPEPHNVSNPNYTPGNKKFIEYKENEFDKLSEAQAIQDTDNEKTEDPKVNKEEFVLEDGPPDEGPVKSFRPRVGDRAIEGSNNALIVIGRDRPKDVKEGEKEEAGTIDIVTGRQDPEDMNMETDKSRVYISSKTDIDTNFKISDLSSEYGAIEKPPEESAAASIGIKSDEVRVFARENFKVVVGGGDGSMCNIAIDTDGNITVEAQKEAKILVVDKATVKITADTESIIEANLKNTVTGDVTTTFEGKEEKTVNGETKVTRTGNADYTFDGEIKAKSKAVTYDKIDGDLKVTVDGDVEIKADGKKITLNDEETSIGADADQPLIFGDEFFKELKKFVDHVAQGKFVGDLAGIPILPHPDFIAIALPLSIKLGLPAVANPMKSDKHKVKK